MFRLRASVEKGSLRLARAMITPVLLGFYRDRVFALYKTLRVQKALSVSNEYSNPVLF